MRERGSQKMRVGVVTSDKMQKTVTVLVTRRVKHSKYGTYMNRRKRFHAHDENGECRVGDKVRISDSRPLSKTKRWRVVETLEKAPVI